MKRALLFSVWLLANPVQLLASPTIHLITESDPGGPNNVVLSSYDSLSDLVNLAPTSTSPIFGFPSAVSISGLAFDGTQYHIITESDPGGPNNVVLSSYDSLSDLVNLAPTSTSPIFGFPSAVSISGLLSITTPMNSVPEPPSLLLVLLAGLTVLMMVRTRTGDRQPMLLRRKLCVAGT